jgi:hypothetical protein
MIHKSAGILLPQRNLKSRRLGAEKLNSIGLLNLAILTTRSLVLIFGAGLLLEVADDPPNLVSMLPRTPFRIGNFDDLVREHRTIFNRYATVIGAHRTVFLKDA